MKLLGSVPVQPPRRVLVIQLRRIGDMLLGTPALRALAQAFPGVAVDVVAEAPAHEVLLEHPRVDRLLVAPRRGVGAQLQFVRRMRQERYDWAVDFLSNPRSAQLAWLSRATVRLGLDRRGRGWAYTHRVAQSDADMDVYAAQQRLDMLGFLGVPAAGLDLEIHADRAEPLEVERVHAATSGLPRPVVAVAVGSPNPAKRYPEDLTAAVVDTLGEQGYGIVLTSGPGEEEYAARVQAQCRTPVAHVADARVPTLTALYRVAHAYVGPDSAPKHIAVACGLPTVTVFGPGRPSAWNPPQAPRQVVLVAPCDIRPRCREEVCGREGHLRGILPATVVSAVNDLVPT